jgi:hypothetical protein
MDQAFCEICGKQWAALDPGVRYVYGDGRWECADEVACFDRRAMQQALDDVWAQLEQMPVTRSPFEAGWGAS